MRRVNPTSADAAAEAKAKEPRREGYWSLLRAVPRTVAKHGFRGLTYRALAEEAGVTYGLISYHFGTREALIEEAAKVAVEDAIVGSTLVPESGDLRDFAAGLTTLLREDAPGQSFQFDLVTESLRNPKLHPPVTELYTRYITAVEAALHEFGIDDDPALARVVFAALDGITLQHFVFADEPATEASLARLRELIASAAAK
jgi:TetR/AcrR family transcriptional regulator, regulator of biofilm formation and stress response